MKDKQFTLTYLEGEEMEPYPPSEGFDTIQEAKQWCNKYSIAYELLSITEWDLGTLAGDGLPEIIAIVNLSAAIQDGAEDLFKYQSF